MNIAVAWLLTFALHSVLLLIAACVIERAFALRNAWRELLWRTALFGGVFTATLQLASGQLPLAGRLSLADEHTPVATAGASAQSSAPIVVAQEMTPPSSEPPPSSEWRPSTSTTPQPTRFAWPSSRWLVWLWLIGASIALGRIATQWRRLHNAFADAVPLDDANLIIDSIAIAERARIAPPALFVMDALSSPVALHGSRIVLPAWAVDSLDREHLRAMLAHETAHIARRDAAWKSLSACWRAIFWFVPNAIAQRKLDQLAELACDAFAAECLGDTRGLAECLVVCAEHYSDSRLFDLAPAMAARKSSLLLRIDRLLEGVAMETATSGNSARAVALSALIAAALALPAVGIDSGVAHAASASHSSDATRTERKGGESSVSVHSNDDSTVISFSDDHRSFSANIHGKPTLNDAETEIVGLSDGGTATLEETADGKKQRIELSERGGKLERHFFIGTTEHAYDDTARAFMATAALELERSGIDAENRAKRLYAQGGAKRVLDEIAHLHSGYAGGLYLRTLLDTGKLAPDDLDRAIALAGNFDSDYERRQSLTHLFETQPLDAARQVAFLEQIGRFRNDYDRAEMLVATATRLADAPQVRQAWFDAARGLRSDYDRRRTYEAMLSHGGADERQIDAVIDASSSMRSDFDRDELLKMAAKNARNGEAIADRYAKSAEGISSDYERRDAMMALMRAENFGPRAASAVLDAAAQVRSASDRTQMLIALAQVMPGNDELRARYRKVASGLSPNERSEAENALVR